MDTHGRALLPAQFKLPEDDMTLLVDLTRLPTQHVPVLGEVELSGEVVLGEGLKLSCLG